MAGLASAQDEGEAKIFQVRQQGRPVKPRAVAFVPALATRPEFHQRCAIGRKQERKTHHHHLAGALGFGPGRDRVGHAGGPVSLVHQERQLAILHRRPVLTGVVGRGGHRFGER